LGGEGFVYWRFFRTAAGRRVIKEDLDALDDQTAANIKAAMDEVVELGINKGSKPVQGDIREVDAEGPDGTTYRLLFARDGHQKQILLAVVLFEKRTQKTPKRQIDLAEKRLGEWRKGRAALEAERRKQEQVARQAEADAKRPRRA
jgi:phage-related protein